MRQTSISFLAGPPDLQTIQAKSHILALVLTGGDRPVEVADAVGDAGLRLLALWTLLTLPVRHTG